jgi:hypothetical protein
MPALKLAPVRGLWVDNTSVIGGALPMQVTGSDFFSDDAQIIGVWIRDSTFKTEASTTTLTLTLLDIDLDLAAISGTGSFPQVSVSNCSFRQALATGGTTVLPVLHENNDVSFADYYDTQGIVQIYAGFARTVFDHNVMIGFIGPWGAADGSNANNFYSHFAGAIIDGYNVTDLSGSLGGGFLTTLVDCHNNQLDVVNTYDLDAYTAIATTLYCRAPNVKVMNNVLGMVNTGTTFNATTGGAFNFAGPLYVDAAGGTTNSHAGADGIISGNTFSRRGAAGALLDHSNKGASVTVDLLSQRGMFVDNTFTDTSVSGTTLQNGVFPEVLFLGPVAPFANAWVVERNRNQSLLDIISAGTGTFSVTSTTGQGTVTGERFTSLTAGNEIRYVGTPLGAQIEIDHVTLTAATYGWGVSLRNVLPPDVTILSVAISALDSNDYTAGTTVESILSINDTFLASALSTTRDMVTETGGAFTLTVDATTGATPIINSLLSDPQILFTFSATADGAFATAADFQITSFLVLYRW